jgi:hypothetical protein
MEYKAQPSTIADFAVLKLAVEVNAHNFLELATVPDFINKYHLSICGYPRSKYQKNSRE